MLLADMTLTSLQERSPSTEFAQLSPAASVAGWNAGSVFTSLGS